jgi:hypothetical protein
MINYIDLETSNKVVNIDEVNQTYEMNYSDPWMERITQIFPDFQQKVYISF